MGSVILPSPYNIFIHFRTLFCCTSFVFNTFFFFTNLQREEAFESSPSSKRLFGGVGGQSFLEQKDWGLENIFLQSPSQNKKHFFTNQKRKLVS
jgi:hypothetical protein